MKRDTKYKNKGQIQNIKKVEKYLNDTKITDPN